jgi:hypothetical protein
VKRREDNGADVNRVVDRLQCGPESPGPGGKRAAEAAARHADARAKTGSWAGVQSISELSRRADQRRLKPRLRAILRQAAGGVGQWADWREGNGAE